MKYDIDGMLKKALAISKHGDANVTVSSGSYWDEEGERKSNVNLFVTIDGVCSMADTFEKAVEDWKAKAQLEIDAKVRAAKKLLAQEGA